MTKAEKKNEDLTNHNYLLHMQGTVLSDFLLLIYSDNLNSLTAT